MRDPRYFVCGCDRTPENSYYNSSGVAYCRYHHLIRMRKWQAKRQAEWKRLRKLDAEIQESRRES